MQNHNYASDPLEWPLLTRGIAYFISKESNAQVHLLGNVAVWYAGTASLAAYGALLIVYLMRRRRQCYFNDWRLRLKKIGEATPRCSSRDNGI